MSIADKPAVSVDGSRHALLVLALAAMLSFAPGLLWAHHGRTLILLHPAGAEAGVAGNVVAAYMAEQMGREIKARAAGTPGACTVGVLAREAPLCLVPASAWEPLEGLVRVGGALRVAGVEWALVVGEDVAKELAFSLVGRYIEILDGAFHGLDLSRQIAQVAGGAGARGLAEELLRKADLI